MTEETGAAGCGGLRFEDLPGVRLLTIDDPATKNALSPTILRALPGLLDEAQRDGRTHAVIIRGGGRSGFCSGFDLRELRTSADPEEASAILNAALDAIADCSVPVIASIDGWCIGAGLELALTCDLRVCTPRSFFRLPAAQLGISYPEHGLARIVAVVGWANATRVVLLGERLDAAEAARVGLVHAVAEDAGQAARSWAARIGGYDRAALANMKKTLGTL